MTIEENKTKNMFYVSCSFLEPKQGIIGVFASDSEEAEKLAREMLVERERVTIVQVLSVQDIAKEDRPFDQENIEEFLSETTSDDLMN